MMQIATENITINELRAKAADRPYRLARLGARPLPHRLLPPPSRRRVEIIDCNSDETVIEVAQCRNEVVFVLGDTVEPGAQCFIGPHDQRLKTANIQRVVAEHFGVTTHDLVSRRRTANVVRPRQVAMYLAKTLTLRSLPEIGRRFGGRDHTTVLHAVHKLAAEVESDPETATLIETLTIKLKGRAS